MTCYILSVSVHRRKPSSKKICVGKKVLPRGFNSILKFKKTTLLTVKIVFNTAQEKNSGAAI